MTRDITREDELYALTMKDTYGSLSPEEEARADALVAERALEIRRGKYTSETEPLNEPHTIDSGRKHEVAACFRKAAQELRAASHHGTGFEEK
jgi:hypothetical protein